MSAQHGDLEHDSVCLENTTLWGRYSAESIPTKSDVSLPASIIASATQGKKVNNILDLGCGVGRFLLDLLDHIPVQEALGVDINVEAIDLAQKSTNNKDIHFKVGDVLEMECDTKYDLVTLQLMLSVVDDRVRLLQNAKNNMIPGGVLYLSASGVSSDINPKYKDLYERDFKLTGEMHTYYSRDPTTNEILYKTHHFTEEELDSLLKEQGFVNIKIHKIKETSSRRKEEQAYFLYASANKKND
ncbi:demethylmenaquinone methyltransferase [Acrasis kona]|uniref:Demethylmenaquinone methyltransferase n=1 Tax=Acrasis kona TaxID=1008807 RepID=A0AAW2ZBI8_9EUKA